MRKIIWPKGKTAQEIQDDIFRSMAASRKIQLASNMWKLARELNIKSNGRSNRSKNTFAPDSQNT